MVDLLIASDLGDWNRQAIGQRLRVKRTPGRCFYSRNGKKFVDWWVVKCTSTIANISGTYRRININIFIVNGPKKPKFRGYDGMTAYFGCHRGKLHCLYLVLGPTDALWQSNYIKAYYDQSSIHHLGMQLEADVKWGEMVYGSRFLKTQNILNEPHYINKTDIEPNRYPILDSQINQDTLKFKARLPNGALVAKIPASWRRSSYPNHGFLPVLAHRPVGMSHLVLEAKSMACRCMFL